MADKVEEARALVQRVVDHVYEHGYHEHGFDIIDALIAAVREEEREAAVGRVMTRTRIPNPDVAWDWASVLGAIRDA